MEFVKTSPVMKFFFFSVAPDVQKDCIMKDYELKFKNSKYNCRVRVILLDF